MAELRQANTTDSHEFNLKDAIYYLPPEMDNEVLYKALKAVYGDEDGKEIATEWFYKAKLPLPLKFDNDWESITLTAYQEQNLDKYLSDHIYSIARGVGWLPKAFRKGNNTKKPPSKLKLKTVGKELKATEQLEQNLAQAKEADSPEDQRSFIPPHITNLNGACYFHPYMKKDSIPEDREEYLNELTKIVDCEVIVEECVEYLMKQPGQIEEDKVVKYRIRLTNGVDKYVKTIATYEDLTTKTRFSSFLVSKGFVKFIGTNNDFNKFHTFLINEQEYPTVKNLTSWGEHKPGEYLFENGLFDVNEGQFYPADKKNRIKKGSHFLLCPSGSDQIRPPRISVPKDEVESAQFLAEKFKLWESFNGRLNIRVTLGFAVACLFSRKAMEVANDGFPFLFKFGERGTGKSSSMDWFMSLFGYQNGNRQSISTKNTEKGLSRQMTKVSSFPFFLDDYRDHKTNSGAPNMTTSFLNWFSRMASTMAMKSTDHRTIDTPMNACVVMTGNDKPTDPAARSRMIVLTYNNFIKKEQISKLSEITEHLHRFSEFTYLILNSFDQIENYFMKYLKENLKDLANEDFEGRNVKVWSYVTAGIQCIPHILPDLSHWEEEFEGLRTEIIEAIKKEEAQQKEFNPLHEFFQELEYFSTQKFDAASEYNLKFNVLDHRHFRYKAFKEFNNNGDVYQGEALYLHITRVWQALQSVNAEITKKTSLEIVTNKLENSSYFLANSEQIQLTSSIDQINKETNRRCHVLSIKQLKEKEMLLELIERAQKYEQERPSRLSP